MQRHDFATTLMRRCVNVMCPLCSVYSSMDKFNDKYVKELRYPNIQDIQSNFNGSNIFGTFEFHSRHEEFEPLS